MIRRIDRSPEGQKKRQKERERRERRRKEMKEACPEFKRIRPKAAKLGLGYSRAMLRSSIEPGVQDIVRFLNEEIGLRTVGSCEGHDHPSRSKMGWVIQSEPGWVIIRFPRDGPITQKEMREIIGEEFDKTGYTYHTTDGNTTLMAKFGGMGDLTIMADGDKARGWNEWKARFRRWFGQWRGAI